MLKDKVIILGVSSSIAAYKIADLASRLAKEGCEVHVLMTENATQFLSPVTFETLTGHKCIVDTFDRSFQWDVKHVSLAKKADAVLIAPATANVIAKMAHGIADDMLTTTVLAATCVKIAAPAMNTAMYQNAITQRNINTLIDFGFQIVEPVTGVLACKDVGNGKLAPVDTLYDALVHAIAYQKDLDGKKVLVTAGPTIEAMDPVRFITNHSSGKMGYEIAKAAANRGAQVTLVSGPVTLKPPYKVAAIPVQSAQEMHDTVIGCSGEQDIIIKAAAVSDYRPKIQYDQKLKKSKDNIAVELVKNPDILESLGLQKKAGQFLCGFAMETENLEENAKDKLKKKHLDMIIANSLTQEGAGFQGDTNVATILTKDTVEPLPLMDKKELAHKILDRIVSVIK